MLVLCESWKICVCVCMCVYVCSCVCVCVCMCTLTRTNPVVLDLFPNEIKLWRGDDHYPGLLGQTDHFREIRAPLDSDHPGLEVWKSGTVKTSESKTETELKTIQQKTRR
ncbi:Hypothetical predicted protein [Xyrichtys novacula]|uniref:Uncharacterized protein n=1 Tax=Xyrichtys novacula TaxID=13765 RepID=A0AAV1EHZ5_XYRNO|nr:Hypothetical predicted protein [Xyrichtys novacula]